MPHAPAAAGALFGVLGAAGTLAWAKDNPVTSSGELQIALMLLSLASTVPLGLLWGQPAAAALVVSAACLLSLALLHTLTVAGLVVQLILLYRLGRHGAPQLLAAGLAMLFGVLALTRPVSPAEQLRALLLAALAPVAAWSGIALRARRQAAAHNAAEQLAAGSLLEHTARGERARISRELHDVVAHHISMIAVQAETARLTTADMPAAGAQRLSAIGDTARAALTEMRRLLGVLREDTGASSADLRPQPNLRQLNELLDQARDASASSTRLIVQGSPASLDPGVELAGYRIIQEALTNSRRHAPGAAVDVELHYTPQTLRVRIRDNGRARPPNQWLPGREERPRPAPGQGTGCSACASERRRSGARCAACAGDGGFIVEAILPAVVAAVPAPSPEPAPATQPSLPPPVARPDPLTPAQVTR